MQNGTETLFDSWELHRNLVSGAILKDELGPTRRDFEIEI